MLRTLCLAVVISITASLAADFTGQWAGTATDARGAEVPIHITIAEQDGVVFGNVHHKQGGALAIGDAVIQGDQLRFALPGALGTPADYLLRFVVAGRPPGEPRIWLEGTAKAAGQQSTLVLYPVSDNPPLRNAVVLPPVLVHSDEPRYTDQARAANIEGKVQLQIEIEETGLVSDNSVRVVRGLGYGLDHAAIEAIRQWRFKPALKNGFAIRCPATVEVPFRR